MEALPISSSLLNLCQNYNLINDINHCILMLTHVTNEFENENLADDKSMLYIPS